MKNCCGLGWSDFWRKKVGHMSCCSTLFWDPESKILLWSVASSPGAWPQKTTKIPQKRPKIRKIVLHIFKRLTWNQKSFLILFKNWKQRETWKQFFFLGLNRFCHFWKIKKNTKQILILNSIFDNCSFT